MFSTLSPKERAGYAVAATAALAALAFYGARTMRPSPSIVIEAPPGRSKSFQPLLDSPDGQDSANRPDSKPSDMDGALVVHIVGAVLKPGLYRFESGKRVADAIARAGGSKPNADLESINLAAKLVDGTQLQVPAKALAGAAQSIVDPTYSGAASQGAYARSGTSGSRSASTISLAPNSISLNTASKSDLDRLPGVGPSTAQKILDYRHQAGGFSSIDELVSVKGIGPKKLAAMRKYLKL